MITLDKVKVLQKKYRELAKEKEWDISFSYKSGMTLKSEKGYIKASSWIDKDRVLHLEIKYYTKSAHSNRHHSSSETPIELKSLAYFYFDFCKEYAALINATFIIFTNRFYSNEAKEIWRKKGFLDPKELFEEETYENIRDTFPILVEDGYYGKVHPRFLCPLNKELLCSLYRQRVYARDSLFKLQQQDPLFFWEEQGGGIQISFCKQTFYFNWKIDNSQNHIYERRTSAELRFSESCDKKTVFLFFANWKKEIQKKHRLASVFQPGSFYIEEYVYSLKLEKREKEPIQTFLFENFNVQELELHCAHTINTFKKDLSSQKKTVRHMGNEYMIFPLWEKYIVGYGESYRGKTYTVCDSEESMKAYIKSLMTKEIDALLLESL